MKTLASKKSKKQRGAGLIEYALLVAFIAVNAVAAVRVLGTQVRNSFVKVDTQMSGSGNITIDPD